MTKGIKSVPAQDRDHFGLQMSSGAAHALYRIASSLGKTEAIAMVRWKTGMDLIESKNWLEQFIEQFKAMQPRKIVVGVKD